MKEISKFIKLARKKGFFPDIKTVEGISSDPQIVVEGKKVHLFCSANYLGLAGDLDVKKSVVKAISKYGIHPTGARLVSGNLDIHNTLEKLTAEFKKCEDAITFTTGTLANMGSIPVLVNVPKATMQSIFGQIDTEEGAIFSDELNHASIIDGIRLSRGPKFVYKHLDMEDLENKLKACKNKLKLIITDGVFSMDGDIAPLPELVNLAKHYDAMLMVDDAHGTGVLGEHGRGTEEYYGINSGVDISMGTFSKAFGTLGGFIAGKKTLIDYLRISARTYIFSGAFPGLLAAGTLTALEIVKNDSNRRKKLWANTDYLRRKLNDLGYNTLNSQTPIIPLYIGDEQKAIDIARQLFDEGILAPCIRWPAVPRGESRIRLSVIATHTMDQIDYLIDVLEKLGTMHRIID